MTFITPKLQISPEIPMPVEMPDILTKTEKCYTETKRCETEEKILQIRSPCLLTNTTTSAIK